MTDAKAATDEQIRIWKAAEEDEGLNEDGFFDGMERDWPANFIDALIARIEMEQERANRLETRWGLTDLLNENATLRAMLKIARCPDTNCQDGAVPIGPDPDGHWEASQCQWCHERSLL